MRKNFDDYKKWYVAAVKSHLILRAGLLEADADDYVRKYHLAEKIEECPDLALFDDPKTVAKAIIKKYGVLNEKGGSHVK